jgi:predicted branched-subunit amino acid permease
MTLPPGSPPPPASRPDLRERLRRCEDRLLLRAVLVGLAVGAFGVTYGVVAVASGLSPATAVATSILVFAGASQFAFVAVGSATDPLTGALSGILLNLRLIAFGYALAPRLEPAPLSVRLLDGYLTTDESAAVAFDGPAQGTRNRLWVTGVSVGCFWVASTTLGAFGGDLIGDVRTYGLDVAFPAAFVALLAPGLRSHKGRLVAALGAALALGAMLTLPPGLPVFVAGLAVLPFIRWRPVVRP